MNTYYASPHHYHTLKYPFHDTQLVNLTLGYLPRVLPSTLKGYWPNISVNFSIDFCFMWEWDGAKRFYVVASSTPSLTLPVQDYVLLPPPPQSFTKGTECGIPYDHGVVGMCEAKKPQYATEATQLVTLEFKHYLIMSNPRISSCSTVPLGVICCYYRKGAFQELACMAFLNL